MASNLEFLNNTADGATSGKTWQTGAGVVSMTGTFNGASVSVEFSVDGTNYVSVGADGTLTAAGAYAIYLPSCSLRLNITGSGGSTDVDVRITGD